MIWDWAVEALKQYGLSGIFLVIALEYACLPMPSEVLLPLAGLSAAAAGIPLVLVVAVSVFAGLIGSCICYAVGAWGGRPALNALLKRFPKALNTFGKTSAWQEEIGGLSVMIARVIPLFRTWISFAAGMSHHPIGSFMLYSTIGIIIWNTVLIGSGYYLYLGGVAAQTAGNPWLMPMIAISIAVVSFAIRRIYKNRRQRAA